MAVIVLRRAVAFVLEQAGGSAPRQPTGIRRHDLRRSESCRSPSSSRLSGFPGLLTGVTVALVVFHARALAALHQNLFGSINAFPLLAIPFFIYAAS